MAIELKPIRKLLKITGYHFVDGKKVGKEYKTAPKVFEGARSIEEAEFLAELAIAPNPKAFAVASSYSGKKSAIADILGNEDLIQAIEAAEFEARKKQTVSDFVDLARKGNAEAGDYDHKKMADLISIDLVEFPAEISEDSRVQDSAGYAFLMEVIGKSTDAVVKRYQTAILSTNNPYEQTKLIKACEVNSKLFAAEIKVCVNTLLVNKINGLIAARETAKGETRKNNAEIEQLRAAARQFESQAREAQVVINKLKQSIRDAREAQMGGVGDEIAEKMTTIVDETGRVQHAEEVRDRSAERLADAQALAEAAQTVFNDLNTKQIKLLTDRIALLSDEVEVPAIEIIRFVKSGELPPTLKLKKPNEAEREAVAAQITERIAKVKKEILTGTREPEPGE